MDSDKVYWHRYIPEYERTVFNKLAFSGNVKRVLEFGVLEGASISWLAHRFPRAEIVGVDILDISDKWPRDSRIHYLKVDQSDRIQVRQMFTDWGNNFDLIIDDGSHHPEHQVNCLVEGVKALIHGGFYILEDIHTSYSHSYPVNAFHVLLAIKHLKEIKSTLYPDTLKKLTVNSYLKPVEIYSLFSHIEQIYTYRRSCLPLKCWKCGGVDFDYIHLRCNCGVDLYSNQDSMAFMIQV